MLKAGHQSRGTSSLERLTPWGNASDGTPCVMNTPSCCGSHTYYFPPKVGKKKIENWFLHGQDHYNLMVIVLGQAFPPFIRKVCNGVGVIDVRKCKRTDHTQMVKYTEKNLAAENRKYYESPHSAADSAITRLSDDVFFLSGIDYLTDKCVKDIKKMLMKDDIMLAISADYQEAPKKALTRNGFKVVKSMNNPNTGSILNLHYFRK